MRGFFAPLRMTTPLLLRQDDGFRNGYAQDDGDISLGDLAAVAGGLAAG